MTIDEINQKAMEMIVAAGSARNNLNMALNALYEGDEAKYNIDEVDENNNLELYIWQFQDALLCSSGFGKECCRKYHKYKHCN